jgi:hypothetical protein
VVLSGIADRSDIGGNWVAEGFATPLRRSLCYRKPSLRLANLGWLCVSGEDDKNDAVAVAALSCDELSAARPSASPEPPLWVEGLNRCRGSGAAG